ncbi:galectin-8-like isoform X2 [Lycorma delicatula]
MSARWALCNPCSSCCRKKVTDTDHFYCGCQTHKIRSKMLADEGCATADVDKQTLIATAHDALEYDFVENKKEQWEIQNPSVPFQSEFCDVLEAGRCVTIHGTVLQNALSFTVNFCKGTGEDGDIGFHMNPRFDQYYIPRNCRLKGAWGTEEAQTYCKYPFRRGKQFLIEIFLTHNEFLIAINGVHFCAFRYRYPLFEMDTLEIFGSVNLHKIHFKETNEYPGDLIQSCDGIERLHNFSIPRFSQERYMLDLSNCETPHVISLNHQLCIGSEIEISGRAKLLPHSFYINLQQGDKIWPHPIVNFHINTRFKEMTCTSRSILANAWIGEGWGKEEFASVDCFFLPGHLFKIQIFCTTDAFHVYHNDQPTVMFKHRTDFTKINTIYIVGDISLSYISFH